MRGADPRSKAGSKTGPEMGPKAGSEAGAKVKDPGRPGGLRGAYGR